MTIPSVQAEQMIDAGVALGRDGRLDEAVSMFHHALAIDPQHPRAYANLAVAFERLGQLDGALAAAQRSIELRPGDANPHLTLGKILVRLNRLPQAIASYRRALQIAPPDPEAHGALAKALLLSGDFKRGWVEFEWRWKAPSFMEARRTFSQPQWTGVAKLAGKTILLHHEQGFGDTIQFVRYAPLFVQRDADVIVQAPQELVQLIRHMPAAPDVIPLGAAVPPCDFHIPLMSLPLAMNTTLKTIPANIPYLVAAPKVAQVWAERVKNDPPGLRVGLAWAGRPTHQDDARRSIALHKLAPLASAANITFYSLQKWDPNHEAQNPTPGMRLIDAAPRLFDFSDSAALIANLDLVIAVDTAVAHLAGAMGKPVWLLLPFSPDFRWLLDRTDSPWYPTMRLFRQPRPGDWDSVIAAVAQELATYHVR